MIPNNLIDTKLAGLSEQERQQALKILKDFYAGSSKSLNELLYKDYEEIPVDIHTFLHDPKYLGKGLTDEEGRFTLFPYWENFLKEIYPDPLKPAIYNTVGLTGGIGLGKSTEAVIIGLYELYRMLCLRDPYIYYGLQPIDSSSWFMDRGTLTKSDVPEWKPPKGIELIAGSQTRHIIGRAVYWCLDGDTVIKTSDGEFKIKDLEDKPIRVYNLSSDGDVLLSDLCTVKMTGRFSEAYDIELEDGSIMRCTPNHRFMLKDGTYKEAKDLTLDDELMDFAF